MHTIKNISVLTIFAIFFASSCTPNSSGNKVNPKTITGMLNEVSVVLTQEQWDSPIGAEYRRIFNQQQPGVSRLEPVFDLKYYPEEKFKGYIQHRRNLILTEISDKHSKAIVRIKRGVWAKYQLVIFVQGPTQESVLEKLKSSEKIILQKIREEEMSRLRISSEHVKNASLMAEMVKNHKIRFFIPYGFKTFAKDDNFMWIAKKETETKQFSCMLYYYDVADSIDITPEFLLAKRDSITKKHIIGGVDGSYMQIERMFEPDIDVIDTENGKVVEIRGQWKMENGDMMGGSFINLTVRDEVNNRIVCLDGFLYHPNKPHRDMVRRLESMLYSFEFVE